MDFGGFISALVLICGNEQLLTLTRAEMLRHVGFQVHVSDGVALLDEDDALPRAELAVLCHTLSAKEQEKAHRLIVSRAPEAKFIVMSRGKPSDQHIGFPLLASEGPQALIDLSRQLTQR